MATASAPQAELHTPAQPKLALSRATQQLLQLWHLTSLDAPTVAVTWILAFAWTVPVHLPFWLPVTLALSAWTFYVADRLMDAKSACISAIPGSVRSVPSKLRPRHLYHWQHRRIFLPVAIASALTALGLVLYYMPLPARERNSILAAATLLYFATVHTRLKSSLRSFLRLPKELIVGILFTLACTLPVFARIPAAVLPSLAPSLIVATLLYIALAWLNCHAIESWESRRDGLEGKGSITRLALAQAVVTASAAMASFHHPRISLLLLAATLSAFLLFCLDRNRRHLEPTTLRAAADLALLTPLLLLALR